MRFFAKAACSFEEAAFFYMCCAAYILAQKCAARQIKIAYFIAFAAW